MNRAQRRRVRPARRRRAITGLTFLAASSVVTSYAQILRAPGAYAAATSCTVTDSSDYGSADPPIPDTLRYCMTQVQSNPDGGTIAFDGVLSITLQSALPPVTQDTTINGPVTVTPPSGFSGFGFLKVSAAGKTLNLNYLTIEGFTPTDESVIDSSLGGTVNITYSYINENTIHGAGSAVHVVGTLNVTESTFTSNLNSNVDPSIGSVGGAIFIDGPGTITSSTFDTNKNDLGGGAIYKTGNSTLTITGGTFTDNGSNGYKSYGGAILVSEVDALTITDSTFTSNSTSYGGALHVRRGGSIKVMGSRFYNNYAAYKGGAIHIGDTSNPEGIGSLSIDSSTFVSNDAPNYDGGAISSAVNKAITITNSYLGGNTAATGAAVSSPGDLTLNFSTLLGNVTNAGSADVYIGGNLISKGTLISSAGTACAVTGLVTDQYSISTDSTCSFAATSSLQGVTSGQLDLTPDSAVYNGVLQNFQKPSASSVLVTGAPTGDLGTGIDKDQLRTMRSGSFTIGSIQAAAAPSITDGSPPSTWTVSTPYAGYTFTASGSPAPTWSLGSGSLPPGLTLNPTTGQLSGTPTTAGAYTFTVTATNSAGDATTSSITITIAAAGGGGGGGGGGGTQQDSESANSPDSSASLPQPAPSASTPARPSLDPINNPQNPNVPGDGLPPGRSVLLVDGKPTTVTIRPDAPRNPTGLDAIGDGWGLQVIGRGEAGQFLGLNEQQALILQSRRITRSGGFAVVTQQPVAQASGSGFAPNEPVKFYLLPNTLMGQLVADPSGSFAGSIPVPAGIAPGTYTMQMNGLAPSGAVRSLSLGVIVKAAPATATTRTQVSFRAGSATLSKGAKAALRRIATAAKAGTVSKVAIECGQPTRSSAATRRRSAARANAVAAYLKSLGVSGTYVVRSSLPRPAGDRRVTVTITSAKP